MLLSGVHILALAICTYIAAIEIKTILVSGWNCSATGIAMAIAALASKQPLLALAGFLTPFLAVFLFILEAFALNLGPVRAAQPFCIAFIVNQVLCTLIILVQLSIFAGPGTTPVRQITIRTLMVSMVSFSVFFAIARSLLSREHNWLMALALALLGLTFVGLTVALYTAFINRKSPELST